MIMGKYGFPEGSIMEKIASFSINHLKLEPGIYISRVDERDGLKVTTFDLRVTRPNREPVMDMAAIHTVEHLGATYLRSSPGKEDIVYFGPMGCRTGFYLVVFGAMTPQDILDRIKSMCAFIIGFEGEIPGAKPAECGNCLEQNLRMAQYYMRRYLDDLNGGAEFVYPE